MILFVIFEADVWVVKPIIKSNFLSDVFKIWWLTKSECDVYCVLNFIGRVYKLGKVGKSLGIWWLNWKCTCLIIMINVF